MKKHVSILAITAVSVLSSGAVRAAVVLNIDLSDPSAAVISASGAFADANDASANSGRGIILRELLTANQTSNSSLIGTGDLVGGGSGEAYNVFLTKPAFGALGARDANLFFLDGLFLGTATQAFSTTAPAFSGVATWNLSSISALLPGPGATGDIFAGDQDGVGPVAIGQWAVLGATAAIPEPSSFAIWSLLGLVVGGSYRYRRKRQVA